MQAFLSSWSQCSGSVDSWRKITDRSKTLTSCTNSWRPDWQKSIQVRRRGGLCWNHHRQSRLCIWQSTACGSISCRLHRGTNSFIDNGLRVIQLHISAEFEILTLCKSTFISCSSRWCLWVARVVLSRVYLIPFGFFRLQPADERLESLCDVCDKEVLACDLSDLRMCLTSDLKAVDQDLAACRDCFEELSGLLSRMNDQADKTTGNSVSLILCRFINAACVDFSL